MHIFFSGIGGTAIGPLAIIAQQAGYIVSGSDKQDSQYIEYLKNHGVTEIHIGQSYEAIKNAHNKQSIDWYVYSSAVAIENPDAPELQFCHDQGIKISKRDELLNLILTDKHLRLVAVAGTHGKTTTTALVVWIMKELGLPISYSVGAKISFGEMGQFTEQSQYFIYEADEFDRNFLAFEPYLSIITGVTWDHHEIFPTREDYQQAFIEFIDQSQTTLAWEEDADYLSLPHDPGLVIQHSDDPLLSSLTLKGHYNRLDAWLAVQAVIRITSATQNNVIDIANRFPGLQRRMEELLPNLFSDYAHTPEKIRGCLSVASELAAISNQKVIVVYEPLTNRRQHFMKRDYLNSFKEADHVYWVPSYLAREDPTQRIIPPEELIASLSDPTIASPKNLDNDLKKIITGHLKANDMVVCIAGGGGGSLDEWVRKEFLHA
ncbi:MAG: UDP-N-acetylmuramate--L-alanine ligase [Candidatus Saccharimonadales bacterium]